MTSRAARALVATVVLCVTAARAAEPVHSRWVYPGPDGKLVYTPDADGNVIPDFSHAGYGGGGVRIPDAPVKITLEPQPGDAGPRIQAAIDEVAKMPLDAGGLRGAVLLKKGRYNVPGVLRLNAGGVVLRGEGDGEDGTVLVATGTEKRLFLAIEGSGERTEVDGTRADIADDYVPTGSRSFRVASTGKFSVGDRVVVQRNANEAWIHEIGMDRIPPNMRKQPDGSRVNSTKQWTPGEREAYDRVITAIDGDRITIDAPLCNAFAKKHGGGWVYKYDYPGRIAHVGVENLRAVVLFQPKSFAELKKLKEERVKDLPLVWENEPGPDARFDDLQHANSFCRIDHAENVWMRNVTSSGFYDAGISTGRGAKWVTVQDCDSLIADNKFYAAYTYVGRSNFNLTGQLTLVQRCYGLNNRHTFCIQSMVGGPNVFLDCDARNALNTSEPHHRWSTGTLYDRVGLKHPSPIQIINRGNAGSGHGWAGANSVLWNCVGKSTVQMPPTAFNYAIGCRSADPKALAAKGDAYDAWGTPVEPSSLYLKQLEDRLGAAAVANIAR